MSLQAGLQPNDDISIHYEACDELLQVVAQNHDMITSTVKQPLVSEAPADSNDVIILKTSKVGIGSDDRKLCDSVKCRDSGVYSKCCL